MPALKICYIAAPPQLGRTGSLYPGTYEVGDRLTCHNLYGSTYSDTADVWVCTTPGTLSNYISPNYPNQATYSNGTAVFTRQASTGWSTALPEAPYNSSIYFTGGSNPGTWLFCYVDADYALGGYGMSVCVDRTTMLPRSGRAFGGTNGPLYYGDVFSKDGRRSGSRLANRNVTSNQVSWSSSSDIFQETTCTLPAGRAPTYYTDFKGKAARVRVRGVTAPSLGSYGGSGFVMEFPEATSPQIYSAQYAYAVADGSMAFTKMPNLSPTYDTARVITVPTSAIATRDLYRAAPTFGGTTAKPDPPRYSIGQNCKLEWVTHTYRNGAAPTGSETGCLRWVGTGNANTAPWTSGYIYLFNSLTGARTLKVFFYTDSLYVGDITNKDVWVEVFHNNAATSGYVMTSSENANWGIPNVVGTVWPAGSETWTTTQTGTFTTFEIAVSLTIGRAGLIAVRLRNLSNRLGPYKVFVDPYMTVT